LEKRKGGSLGTVRKPMQGVWNIIRFNWQFYVIAVALLATLLFPAYFLGNPFALPAYLFCIAVAGSTLLSLLASFYVYDVSGLYKLHWLNTVKPFDGGIMVNINAGFDETSALLQNKFPTAKLTVFDFYDPAKHTEVSIKRARKAYPPYPGTVTVKTMALPLANNYADKIFLIFAAHEIRDEAERIAFLKECSRILKPGGEIIITEHLRDTGNFLVYNFGFFHFYAKATWMKVFAGAGLYVKQQAKLNPFVSTFILTKHANAS